MWFKPIVVVCTKLVPDHDFYSSLIDTILLGISGKTHKPTRSTEAPSIPAGCLGNSSVRTSCQLIPQAVMSWGHASLDWLRNVAVSKESKRKRRHTHSEKRPGGCERKMVWGINGDKSLSFHYNLPLNSKLKSILFLHEWFI